MGRKKLTTAKIASRNSGKTGKLKGATPVKNKTAGTAAREPVVCWCGCGGTKSGKNSHKGRYLPGHDSRAHSAAKRVARREAGYDANEIMATLPNQDARDHFAEHVEAERKRIAAATKATKVVKPDAEDTLTKEQAKYMKKAATLVKSKKATNAAQIQDAIGYGIVDAAVLRDTFFAK